jgi:eukaryotic-like serine/threonine-protein kinase
MFRQVAEERERVLGPEHADTIDARCWAARSLYAQDKDTDAEAMFRQVVEERERVLGPEHADTIDARHWSGRSLYSTISIPTPLYSLIDSRPLEVVDGR